MVFLNVLKFHCRLMRPGTTPQANTFNQPQPLKAGDIAFARMEKVNAELVAITYGALVTQLIADKGNDVSSVNAELEKIGYNIGIRMVDEFLAKYGSPNCQTFKESVDTLSRIAMKMFLGIDSEPVELSPKSFLINFSDNPLNDFVELPQDLKKNGLSYSNLYCGIIRGAFEQLHMGVKCEFLKDVLRGDEFNCLRVELIGIIKPEDDDE